MQLVIDTTEDAQTLTLAGRGEIDFATLDTLTSELVKAANSDVETVVVDLQQVTYIDSSGLGVLVGAHKRLKAQGRALVLRVADAEMIKLLKLTGLDQLFALEMPYGEGGSPAPARD
jgi:anti-sigma B factor antagonist